MKVNNWIIAAFIILLCTRNSYGQLPEYCATDTKVAASLKKFPAKKEAHLKNWENSEKRDELDRKNSYELIKSSTANYIIPVVVHIIHENGSENISDAQVVDAIRVLNDDFAKRNADTITIVPAFQSVAADCQIEFRLAQLDPNGNCTNGIDRIYSSQTNIGDDDSKLNPWPYEMYYNIWVVKNISPGGIAGYAYYPGTAPPGAEGVIVLHNYFGSIGTSSVFNSRVLTHETGHYLDLPHVWGSTNNPGVACGDDGVFDTPITKGWTSCNLNAAVCNAGVIENVQNYMEYSYCTKMFSWGQKARMISALNSSNGARNQLWTTSNKTATGVDNITTLCAADFDAYPNPSALCAGESLTFKDYSYNGQPTSWTWSFPGGQLIPPTTVNDSAPIVYYPNPGTYPVSLTVSNSSGSASKTKASFVNVLSSIATFNAGYYLEDFETSQIPGDWTVNDLDGNGNSWTKSSAAHTSGSFSVKLNSNSSGLGDVDELISPSISVAAIVSPYISFKYAFATRGGGANNKLAVLVSPDCGKTWYQRKGISGLALPTAPDNLGNFIPNASQWRQETVNILNMINQGNVLVKFKFTNEDGNNLYIDDVNILTNLGMNDAGSNPSNFEFFPNPLQSNSRIHFQLNQHGKVNVDLLNASGQFVEKILSQELPAGNFEMSFPKEMELSKGLYFLKMQSEESSHVLKFVVD